MQTEVVVRPPGASADRRTATDRYDEMQRDRQERSDVSAAPAGTWSLCGGASTAAGRGRSANEDAHSCGPVWFAVADGMGGHAAGDTASRVTIDSVRHHDAPHGPGDLHTVVATANRRVIDAARRYATPGMGSTLVAAAALGDDVAIVHIGDSRCYRLDGGVLTLVTRDHTHVQELVDSGTLPPAEAARHRLRHVVTRAVGVDAAPRPDVLVVPGPVGRLLLCSDGLTAELSPRTIGRVLAGIGDPGAAAARLVGLALLGDARDDVTAVVVDHVREAR